MARRDKAGAVRPRECGGSGEPRTERMRCAVRHFHTAFELAFVSGLVECKLGGKLNNMSEAAIPFEALEHGVEALEHGHRPAAAEEGGSGAAAQLLPLVYEELRRLAARRMAGLSEGQTLQPTALVHEAYLRLAASPHPQWRSRAHFFAAAAEAMRHILVDQARRKGRIRHGGGLQRVHVEHLDLPGPEDGEVVLAVSEALDKLAEHDQVGAELIKLRFFVGLPNTEAARLLGLSERTGKRTWAYARAWLFRELTRTD
jgi:RNA polymerase sigma factor (TIGR02999 family)